MIISNGRIGLMNLNSDVNLRYDYLFIRRLLLGVPCKRRVLYAIVTSLASRIETWW